MIRASHGPKYIEGLVCAEALAERPGVPPQRSNHLDEKAANRRVRADDTPRVTRKSRGVLGLTRLT